ncbi:MAG: alpha/beta hydrolase [Actinomycetota bacterium]
MARNVARYLEAEARLWRHVGAEPTERRVALASGGEVRVQDLGEGPPVVFIHGGSIAGASWCRLVTELPGVRCILVDRPGCGLSEPIVGGPLRDLRSVEQLADRLLGELLDALELDRAGVVATSYGGFFAFRGAASIPERVTRLVEFSWLVGAPSESAPLSARLASLPGMQSLTARLPMTRGMVRTALRQFGLGRAIDAGAFDDVMLDWAHALLRHTDTLANDVASSPTLFTPIGGQNRAVLLSDDLLAELTMPVLFLWGEDDPNGGAAVARSFAPRLPDAELVIVPRAEHAPWLDAPELCASRTRAFLLADEPA